MDFTFLDEVHCYRSSRLLFAARYSKAIIRLLSPQNQVIASESHSSSSWILYGLPPSLLPLPVSIMRSRDSMDRGNSIPSSFLLGLGTRPYMQSSCLKTSPNTYLASHPVVDHASDIQKKIFRFVHHRSISGRCRSAQLGAVSAWLTRHVFWLAIHRQHHSDPKFLPCCVGLCGGSHFIVRVGLSKT